MQLTNFNIQEITDEKQRDELNEKLRDGEFIQTDPRCWVAEFDIDGVAYAAGIRIGHRAEIAADIIQQDIQLRIRDRSWEEDSFIPLATVADILRLVVAEIEKRTVID